MLQPIFLWDQNRQSKINDIAKNIDSVTGIVILGPVEGSIQMIPEEQRRQISDLSSSHKLPIYVIIAGHEKNTHLSCPIMNGSFTKVIRWPLFWLSETLVRMTWKSNLERNFAVNCNILENSPNIPEEFLYTFICMNKRPKLHRYILMDKLAKYDLLQGNAVAYREHYEQINYKLKNWVQTSLFLDQENEHFIQEKLPKEYHQSFMQIVSETDFELFFLTEKTAVPLFFYKPFLVASNVGFHQTLKEFGFELYTELFDYSFDNIADLEERYEGLLQNIIKYNNCSKKELHIYYNRIKDKLIYNRNLALRIACDTEKFPEQWNYFAKNFDTNLVQTDPYSVNLRLKEIANITMGKKYNATIP
jgi:hypothetical protein